jgi:hypothetical protein
MPPFCSILDGSEQQRTEAGHAAEHNGIRGNTNQSAGRLFKAGVVRTDKLHVSSEYYKRI